MHAGRYLGLLEQSGELDTLPNYRDLGHSILCCRSYLYGWFHNIHQRTDGIGWMRFREVGRNRANEANAEHVAA
jgi:hypothetical protein